MLRIQDQEERAADALKTGSVDGALAYCKQLVTRIDHARKHRRIENFADLVDAHKTYQEIQAGAAADQGAHEQPDEAYMSATFHGMREAVTHKCGEMPTGCFRCERDVSRNFAGAMWIRHDGARHYIVFTDASGNSTEYRIYFCPCCGKKF